MSYENGIASVEWNTSVACLKSNDGGDNDKGGSDDRDKDADRSSSGSGIGWFFLLYVRIISH